MMRLTLLLLMGIGTTMSIYGTDGTLPQGGAAGNVEVAQGGAGSDFLNGIGAMIEGVGKAEAATAISAYTIPLDDEQRAIEIALAATVAPETPAEPSFDIVRISATGPAVEVLPRVERDTWFVTGTTVNLRGGPSTSESVVGKVRLGQEAEVLEDTGNGWFRIELSDSGETGYIYSKFLSQNRPG